MATALLTGASGRMAHMIRPALREYFDSVRLYARSQLDDLGKNEELVTGHLEELATLENACAGVGVVIHLGGKADEADFSEILTSNIAGTYNVFEAALRAGVARVVYASSHHVTGFYPPNVHVGADSPVRPDSYYGVSKVFGEAMGRLYHDKWGIEVVCLRIGVCRSEPENADQLSTWLSGPDSARMVLAAASSHLDRGFEILYGYSNNTRSFWAREPAGAIGFAPYDSADDYVTRFPDRTSFSHAHQGGAFTAPDYRGGLW